MAVTGTPAKLTGQYGWTPKPLPRRYSSIGHYRSVTGTASKMPIHNVWNPPAALPNPVRAWAASTRFVPPPPTGIVGATGRTMVKVAKSNVPPPLASRPGAAATATRR